MLVSFCYSFRFPIVRGKITFLILIFLLRFSYLYSYCVSTFVIWLHVTHGCTGRLGKSSRNLNVVTVRMKELSEMWFAGVSHHS